MLGFEAAAYAELPGMNYRASWKKSMECVQDGESKIQDHMPKWLLDPWVWMWWNSISNISRHWDQNDQNIIQLKSKEIPHTAVIPTAVLFDCQTVHIWDIIKWTLHEKRFVACIMFALPQPLDIEICDVNYSVIFHIVAFQAWKWEVGYIVDISNISWMSKCSTDDPTVFSTSTINMVHLVHLLLIGICLQVIFLPLPHTLTFKNQSEINWNKVMEVQHFFPLSRTAKP